MIGCKFAVDAEPPPFAGATPMSEQTEYAGFEASEFAENPEPRVACVLLLDTSGGIVSFRISIG
jgi:hypothetical protein